MTTLNQQPEPTAKITSSFGFAARPALLVPVLAVAFAALIGLALIAVIGVSVPNAIAAFTAPANLAGLPALAWPQAVGPQRTVSLQLIGRTGDDLRLLAMADRIDRLLQR